MAALVATDSPSKYQQIARKAQNLESLGLSRRRIAQELGVSDKTVARAIAWQASLQERS